jgi:isopropylmalate/homocitrate/citramalate synthase
LKEKSTYEILDPHSVGVPESKLVLGKHSGRHALKKRTEDLGYDLSKEELQSLYDRFTALADNKKGLRGRRDHRPDRSTRGSTRASDESSGRLRRAAFSRRGA